MRSRRWVVLFFMSGAVLALGLGALAWTLAVGSFQPRGDGATNSVQTSAEAGVEADSVSAEAASTCGGNAPGMANPAAIYCGELGYRYEKVDTPEGQHGICIFPDGSRCDEWRFLEGKCGQGYSYCAKQGYGLITKADGKDPFSREYGVCVRGQEEVGSVTELMALSQLATKGEFRGEEPASPPEEAPSAPALPSAFDWRSYNGQNWMTSVKDQGGCGSCWAFSVVGAVEAAYNVAWNDPNLDLNLSEEYLVSDCHTYQWWYDGRWYQNCCGGWNDLALNFIRDTGIPDEGCLPYVEDYSCSCGETSCNTDCAYHTGVSCSDATCSQRCSDWSSRLRPIEATGWVSSTQSAIKQAIIDHGPVSVCLNFNGDFDAQDVYRCADDVNTNHCVVVLGYNDAGGYWIAKNSWGTGFHQGGYFNVGYGECAIENYVYYAAPPCPPVMPGTYTGSVTLDGAAAPDGTTITASIGGLQWASSTTFGDQYAMDVPSPSPQQPPCFEPGQIVFQANGGTCTPSPDWGSGLHDNTNLICISPACTDFASSDVPKSIPDLTTITSTVNVGASFALTDVNVSLSITHTWDSDLEVFLVSPQGTRVELFTRVDGSGDNFTNTVLDDECASSIASGTAPFTGCYRPEGTLSAFDGEDSSGVWTLEVTDAAGADIGTLQAWSVELCEAWDEQDADGDGWSNGEESHIGTDPLDDCPDTIGDGGDDAWPPDIKIDRMVNILDVVKFKPHVLSCSGDPNYSSRYDLINNDCIDILDVVKMKPDLFAQCANP